ncbi:hypothetical protein BDK51DRAFT_50376 [Blyttiomyces helicus]|uniref:F-box domain-containing protein n=1 Tax=Blyttiomyces helicus TaxID=388810 RepID=A0A4P9WEP4_9FUNG|nr:hypothetical protein BDK51DRAFT_50376 [Blyttiomyces helicus]|eukprot:RKO90872.1 hypothetical protein BDK51DRAFT_50376 [Blyttiomyces helicus]
MSSLNSPSSTIKFHQQLDMSRRSGPPRATQIADILKITLRATRSFDSISRNRSLAAAALVCKIWCFVACEVLWEEREVKFAVRGGDTRADSFERFAASARVSLAGGPPLGSLVRRLSLAVGSPGSEHQHARALRDVVAAFECPNLRSLSVQWRGWNTPPRWSVLDFALVFRKCPALIAFEIGLNNDPQSVGNDGDVTHDVVGDTGEEAREIVESMWDGPDGCLVRGAISRLQLLRLDPRILGVSDSLDPDPAQKDYRCAVAASLREWDTAYFRGLDVFDMLDKMPRLTHIIGYTPPFRRSIATGSHYHNLKCVSLNLLEDNADEFLASLLAACPGIDDLQIVSSTITDATLRSLTAYRPLTRLLLAQTNNITEPALLAFLNANGRALSALRLAMTRMHTDALLHTLPTTCPHLLHVDLGLQAQLSARAFETWVRRARAGGLLCAFVRCFDMRTNYALGRVLEVAGVDRDGLCPQLRISGLDARALVGLA